MGRGRRWVVAVLCALGAGLAPAAPAAAQSGSVSFLIPAGTISMPPSLSGGVVGGLATDASGNLYAGVDKAGQAFVAVFNPAGTFLRQWQVDGLLTLRTAIVLAVGPDGLVYVAPSGGAAADELVRVFTAAGTLVRTFGQGSGLREVTDIELDQAGNVYVTARARADLGLPDDMVVRFNPAGAVAARLVPAPGKAHQFGNALKGLAVGPGNSVYVTTATLDTAFPKVVGLDGAGARLPIPDFNFVLPGRYEDVDLANGKLYLAGKFGLSRARDPFGVATLTMQGEVLNLVTGEGRQLAPSARQLYATGIHGLRSPATRPPATHNTSEIALVRDAPTRIPGPGGMAASRVSSSCRNERLYFDDQGVLQIDRSTVGAVLGASPCDIAIQNHRSPCPPGTVEHVPVQTYLNGDPVGVPKVYRGSISRPSELRVEVIIPWELGAGAVVVEWACVDAQAGITPAYDWKGTINLVDPSGNVLDATTGRPVNQATVRLQFSLRRSGPFGTPGIAGFTPQTNPQVTGRNGAFGWDVAPGFWRLVITAFGYRPFTSPVYSVPPEVTGLKLRLRPDPRQQARLLDPYTGQVGRIRLGGRLARSTRVAGLALRARGGRVRGVTVRAKRFRTAVGIALGSRESALRAAYSNEAAAALRRAKAPASYKVGKATFRVRRGRVVAIVLGR